MPFVKPLPTIITPANVTLDIMEMVLFVTVCKNLLKSVITSNLWAQLFYYFVTPNFIN